MNREIQKVIDSGALFTGERFDLLEISGERWQIQGGSGQTSYTRTSYPEYDVCEKLMERQFDFIIAEQVFEHLPYPTRAGRNIYQMLRDGGFFLISVPFSYPLHEYPIDCTRWSAIGLKYFLNECGWEMDKIHTDSWGNRDCAKAHFDKALIPYEEGMNLENEPDCPVMVWAFAQK